MTVIFAGPVDTSTGIELDPDDNVVVGDGSTPDATLTGGGFVELTTGNTIAGSTIDSVLTNEDSSIEALGGAVDGSGGGNTILVRVRNEFAGTISAVGDGAGNGMLTLAGDVVNEGFLSAGDGGKLVLDGIEIDNTDGVIAAFGATVRVEDSTVIGGTIFTVSDGVVEIADGVLDGTGLTAVQNFGDLRVVGGRSATVVGNIANAGLITIEDGATLVVGNALADEAVLGGGGAVFLSSSSTVEGASPDSKLINLDDGIVTEQGVVTDGTGGSVIDVTMVNAGLGFVGAIGDDAGHGLLTLAGKTTNFGTLAAVAGAKLVVDGTLSNFGLVWANNAAVELNADIGEPTGVLLTGGNGEFLVAANAAGMVSFTGSEGALRLAQADAFSGVVAGAAGMLDLQDIPFNPAPTEPPPVLSDPDLHAEWTGVTTFGLRYAVNATGTGGVLSVVQDAAYDILDGDGVVVGTGVEQADVWSTRLAGQYKVEDFTVGDNGMGGTLVSGTAVTSSSWQTGVNGSWQYPGNWSDGAPDAWTHAELVDGAYLVKVSRDTTVYSLEMGSQTRLRIKDADFWTNEGTGEGINAGTIVVAAGARFDIAGYFEQEYYGALYSRGTIGLHSAYVERGVLDILTGGLLESTVYNSTLQDVYVRNEGTIQAAAGGSLTVLTSSIIGGTTMADGNAGPASIAIGDSNFERGLLRAEAGGTLKTIAESESGFFKMTIDGGTTFDVVGDSVLTLSGWLQNNGTLAVGDTSGATLEIAGTVGLLGAGAIFLDDSAIIGADCGCFGPATLVNSAVIAGTGDIGDATMHLVNKGVIGAFGGELTLDTGSSGIRNQGVLVASTGATLVIESPLLNYATVATSTVGNDGAVALGDVRNYGAMSSQFDGTMSALAIDNNGTIYVDATSGMSGAGKLINRVGAGVLNNGSYEVHSGVTNKGVISSLAGSFTVDGYVGNAGTFDIEGGSTVTFNAALQNLATIAMDSGFLHVVGASENSGSITTDGASTVVHDAKLKNEISGVLSNFGSYEVNAAVANKGLIETEGGSFTIDGNVTNTGSIESELGGQFFINGRLSNGSGTLYVDDAFMFVGSLVGGGGASIVGGGQLEFGGQSNADVSFVGADNDLVLNQSTSFTGNLMEFSTGDRIVFKDMLASDFIDFDYVANSGDTGGTLQVTDVSRSTTAFLSIVGTGYSTADFLASSEAGSFALQSQHLIV